MRKWRWGALLVLVVGFIVFALYAGSEALAADEAKTIRVGIYDNKPKVYLDDNGVAAGLFPDILNYISEKENWQLEYVFGTWEEGLTRLENGEIDVMVDMALSEERQERYDFTNETIFSSWGIVFVRKNSTIKSFQDLDGKKIAVLESSVYYGGSEGIDRYLKAFDLKAELITVSKQADVFDILNQGEVDAGVVSRVFALINQKDYPEIKQTDLFFSPTELRFALTKGKTDNQYLIERLDYWVKELKEGYDGAYQQMLKRHGLTGIANGKEVVPRWIFITVFAGALFLLLSWLIIARLRRARMIALRELKESEQFHKALVEAADRAGIGIVILQNVKDREAAIVSVNDQACSISGYSREESLKMSIQDVIPADIIKQIMTRYRSRQRGSPAPYSYETAIARKDKTKVPIIISLAIMKLHGKTATVVYFRDITESKKSEEEIKKHENELEKSQEALMNVLEDLRIEKNRLEEARVKDEAILGSIADGVIVVNKDSKIILMNQAAEKMLGWKREAALGRPWFEILQREDEKGRSVSPETGAIQVALSKEKVTAADSYYYVRKNKTRFAAFRTVSPIIMGKKVIGAINVFRDVTHEREIDKMKDEFLIVVSHELRTPMTAIMGNIDMVLKGQAGPISEEVREYLKDVAIASDRLINLVNDMLNVSRIEAGSSKFIPKPVDISVLIRSVIKNFETLAREKKLVLKYKPGRNLPSVFADPDKVVQILNNIISNAIRFTPKGSVGVTTDYQRDMVIVHVKDTGIGISEEDKEKLFKKFTQLDSSMARETKGTGLGLYVSRQIVQQMKGDIWMDSDGLDKGSTFSFSLPIAGSKKPRKK
ncbi:MAG: transporter substrate-binding domain-containing protein [Patescibacteria group bacterium]|nr:transporter substrate-binding domain-containing protein [Patescibacteria group bacterium]